jgi:chromosome segregation ATPase
MSTAGKVLSVLSALLLVVWAIMISAVAQINENGAKAVAAKEKSATDLKEAVAKADANNLEYRDKANEEQVQKERELRLAQTKLASVEAQLTSAQESLSRAEFQLENYTKAAGSAKADLGARQQEKVDLEKSLADNTAQVKKLQGVNDDLLNQLEKLRNDFQSALRRNTAEVEKERKADAKPVKTAANDR